MWKMHLFVVRSVKLKRGVTSSGGKIEFPSRQQLRQSGKAPKHMNDGIRPSGVVGEIETIELKSSGF